jgi:DNA polymerase (family 10)
MKLRQDHNQRLAEIFSDMSAYYRYLGAAERFRALAYAKAAKIIRGLKEDVSNYVSEHTLEELPGIGESISEKIMEFLNTGTIRKYEMLRKKVPAGIIDMLEIRGFGPESLRRIHTELKIDTREELIRALQDGRIAKLKGFGAKKTENMLRGLKIHKTIEERMLLWDALQTGNKLLEWIKGFPGVVNAELAGSLRRKKETIGDIDVLVCCAEKERKKIVKLFTDSDFVQRVLAAGDTKASVILEGTGKQVDVRLINENEWGSALQYFTGSKEHNIHLRKLAKEKGYSISEYGIFRVKDGKRVGGKTEEEIYHTLGLKFIPAEMREDKGEIELAAGKKLPELIPLNDIKGDLQMHSTWSDGTNSIAEMAAAAKKIRGWEYIVITDHTESSRIAKGLTGKEILKQLKEIHDLNRKNGDQFIKCGIEVDILPDGTLDVDDEILSQLDWVTASIHSGFSKDNTERIIRACENPFVNCIGHPTGRLIGDREAYTIDFAKIISAAKKTGTALEINAQPQRMDLNDELAMEARKANVPLVISTDSHDKEQFDYMQLGVAIAQRAWCTAGDILNTKSWNEIARFRNKKLSKTKQYA